MVDRRALEAGRHRDRNHRLFRVDHRRHQTTQGTPESVRVLLAFEKALLVQIFGWLSTIEKG